jgi:hypothetical protein
LDIEGSESIEHGKIVRCAPRRIKQQSAKQYFPIWHESIATIWN